jgi:gluconate 2-dehydrogenase alpha chain
MVFLCAFQMFNVQLLLLSGIGQPYDPNTGTGVIGRNFSYPGHVRRPRIL